MRVQSEDARRVLFNSFPFIFAFLPITVLGYELLRRRGSRRATHLWLIAASCVFYAYWNAAFLALLFVSIVVNFAIGRRLQAIARDGGTSSRLWLIVGLVWNLALLGYFKYANFFIDNVDAVFGLHIEIARILLPIGISFFTFQKIAFLVDSYTEQGGTARLRRLLSVRDVLSATDRRTDRTFRRGDSAVLARTHAAGGRSIRRRHHRVRNRPRQEGDHRRHVRGTCERNVRRRRGGNAPPLRRSVARYVVLHAADLLRLLGLLRHGDRSRRGCSAFACRSTSRRRTRPQSIAEFWQRWHITLSRFLRDYLYIPLGGNRRGPARQRVNLMITMLLGGIWHGAAWTFRAVGRHARRDAGDPSRLGTIALRCAHIALRPMVARTLTFVCVVLAWVPFRAADFATHVRRCTAGCSASTAVSHARGRDRETRGRGVVGARRTIVVVRRLPNTYEWLGHRKPGALALRVIRLRFPVAPERFRWQPDRRHGLAFALLLFTCFVKLNDVSPFIYFQF